METRPSIHFTVTVATPEDDVAVGALLDASYPVLMRPAYDPVLLARALPLMTQANPALLASGTFYLAKTEHNIVIGCGGWTRERPGDGGVEDGLGHLRHFATHPAWIGRAVGRSIYEVCEREARFASMTRLACYASLNAEGFYAALGFAAIDRVDVPLGSHRTLPSVLMMASWVALNREPLRQSHYFASLPLHANETPKKPG